MFKKIFSVLFVFSILQLQTFAQDLSSSINSIINSFDFDRDSVVSISIKDKNTGSKIYEKNSHKILNPASVQKIFTMAASMAELGENYNFDMAFYKDSKNNLYLKLSADPFFTSSDADTLAKNLKKAYKGKINKIYIDDSIIDKVSYPDGWTVDDYWPNSPKISPYMINKNTVKVDFYPETENNSIRIIQKDKDYKFAFVNKLNKGNNNSINFIKDDTYNTINVEGVIKSSLNGYELPVLNPKYFFCKKLNNALNKNGVIFHDKFLFAKTPNDAVLVAKFSRPLTSVIKQTLQTSDNLAAEMVFKVAGGSFASKRDKKQTEGTTNNGIEMFLNYYKNLGLNTEDINLRDGSGVSRYNALSADWMTDALIKTNFKYDKYLPTAGEGTLSKRMREMENSAYFKTGTLYGLSSLAGIVKNSNKEYVFVSIIMSYNKNKSLIKGVEDEIVYEVYREINNK